MDRKLDSQMLSSESLQKQNLGMQCVEFVINLVNVYPMLRPLALVLKQFIYMQNLSDPYQGGLSSYALVLMIVALNQVFQFYCYLSINYQFGDVINHVSNLGQYLLAFLHFYGHDMEYSHKMIYVCNVCSPGHTFSDYTFSNQKQKSFMPNLFIQDPLNQANNVGRPTYQIMMIKKAFFYAYFSLNIIDKIDDQLFKDQQLNKQTLNSFSIDDFQLLKKLFKLPKVMMETECQKENIMG